MNEKLNKAFFFVSCRRVKNAPLNCDFFFSFFNKD